MHLSHFVYVSKIAFFSFFLFVAAYAALNGRCNSDHPTGICLHTSKCNSLGGDFVSGACPNDPNDIKCCESIGCSAPRVGDGSCDWIDHRCIPRGRYIAGKQFILVYIFYQL